MKDFILLAIAIFSAFMHGTKEGIVMWKPNPRDHLWFGIYHRISVMTMLGVALSLIWATRWAGVDVSYMSMIGISLLAWQAAECGYGLGRHSEPFPDMENVMGAGFYLDGFFLGLFNGVRIIGGLWLFIGGCR